VKEENCELLADSHNIWNRWNDYFSQLLNKHNVSYVRPLKRDPCPTEVESPGSDQIPAELIQAGGETLRSEIHITKILFGIK
jgi:hypothetical protein